MALLLGRVWRLVSVLLAVTALSFLLINLLPGDPTLAILGTSAGDPQARAEVRDNLHLDDPLPVRYVAWLGGAVRGDLDQSYVTHQKVTSAIAERLPLTIELMLYAELLALAVAVPLGILTARRPNGLLDKATTGTTFTLLALPAFMLGVLLIYLFAVHWKVFPATGETTWFHLGNGVVGTPASLFLPAVTLAAGQLAVFTRVLRNDMVQTLRSEFVVFARSKGMTDRAILLRHALRPSSLSLVTLLGLNVGALIGGAVIVERMFALPGLGQLLVVSIYKRDYMIVQGGVVLIAVGYVLVNFVVDLLYAVLDPRVRRVHAA